MSLDGRRFLSQNPLFSQFQSADFDVLVACANEREMRVGETLFQRGDPGLSMMAVLVGKVQIALPAASGETQVLNVLGQGAVFGEIALFDGKLRSADATAATNGRLLVIERDAILRLMKRDSGFAGRIVETVCARLRATLAQLESMVFQDATQRLAAYLLHQAEEQGVPRIDITQSALGQVVGATRETVNRRLRELEVQGLIALTPGRVTIIDRYRLERLMMPVSPLV